MGRLLVPIAMVSGLAAMVTGALTVAMVDSRPAAWPAALRLVVLAGFVPAIAAVNIRIVPVFARRNWRGLRSLRAQVGLQIAGGWLVFAGRLAGRDTVETLGFALALAGGLLFTVNIVQLFLQPAKGVALPLPYRGQADVDRIAVQFTRLAGLYLLFGLALGLALTVWTPSSGRWDLVWAHAMLVGFVLSMVSGTCYHVLARWTTAHWRALWPIRLHFIAVAAGLPFMLAALATNSIRLFEIAGPLEATAVALFLGSAAPLVWRLPRTTRTAFGLAGLFLLTGVALGASFAIQPVIGVRLRLSHAEINLFGFVAMMIVGGGNYLVPRFAGRVPRWPRLAIIEIGGIAGGVISGAFALGLRGYGHDVTWIIVASQVAIVMGIGSFGVWVAATFASKPGSVVQFQPASRMTLCPGVVHGARMKRDAAASAGRHTAPPRARPSESAEL